jgi:hypothetical protein
MTWWELRRVWLRVFSTLMPRSNENKSCMRVEKREFAWEFSQISCPGQTRTRVAWELVKVDESWEARVCTRVFSTLMPRSNENKSCMTVDKSWLDIIPHVAKTLIKIWTSSKDTAQSDRVEGLLHYDSCLTTKHSWKAMFNLSSFSLLSKLRMHLLVT